MNDESKCGKLKTINFADEYQQGAMSLEEYLAKMDNRFDKMQKRFEKIKYFNLIDEKIRKIMADIDDHYLKLRSNFGLTNDLLDTDKTYDLRLLAKRSRMIERMKFKIWQEVLGNYRDFEVLNEFVVDGVKCELPLIVSHKRKLVAHIANKKSIAVVGSRKWREAQDNNARYLVDLKKAYPDYEIMFANMRGEQEYETMGHMADWFNYVYDNVGMHFVRLVLGDDAEEICRFVTKVIDDCL